jgi:hypothetical protein
MIIWLYLPIFLFLGSCHVQILRFRSTHKLAGGAMTVIEKKIKEIRQNTDGLDDEKSALVLINDKIELSEIRKKLKKVPYSLSERLIKERGSNEIFS